MKKHSLRENKGLSLSQAQSISNLCYQKAVEIESNLNKVNNFSKLIGESVIERGYKLPDNIIELLEEKSKLHACQAFLMENIKIKDKLMTDAKKEKPVIDVKYPDKPEMIYPEELEKIDEEWGWSQLTRAEINEYYEAEAYAAHIGQFIHSNGKLSELRNEINIIPTVDFIELEKDKKTLVDILVHHDSSKLFKLHENLAKKHRHYEQKVNYFKAKVKNLVNQKNSEISKFNSEKRNEAAYENGKLNSKYNKQYNEALEKEKMIISEFEIKRHEKIKKIASFRIDVDKRFQDIVSLFLDDNTE